jgi:hypothetical protein
MMMAVLQPVITVSPTRSDGDLCRRIRSRVERDGQVWVFADEVNYRKLRRVSRRLDPLDVYFFGAEQVLDGGGLLVVMPAASA